MTRQTRQSTTLQLRFCFELEGDDVTDWEDRVAPILKNALSAGKINLTAIVNTHQYAIVPTELDMHPDGQLTQMDDVATGTMPAATRNWYIISHAVEF